MKRRTAKRPEHCRALVTGGSGDLGQAICRRLAGEGLELIVHAASRLERAEQTAEAIRAEGGRAQAVQFDLADAEATAAAMTALTAEAPIGIVVHNAGLHQDAPMAGMSEDAWRRVMAVNLDGFFRVVQPTLLGMSRLRFGRVIAISSVAARLGNRGQANYAAAKAGLHGAILSLSREMAGRGLSFNTIAPGLIDTGMIEAEQIEATLPLIPAGRIGQPDEVAALVAFLCRDEAAYINAQMIGIDGGMAAGH
ncbi:3-oxoacyl-ACP reductase FabG [Wenzhouxiangella marina]|uniref:3-oxoacyl-[acyl-carrier protein] reductase n=1 Tax=Wenzhouxiangella marina TaxID=1579979 RepID=A0A0K0Y0H3_9GAMM|nr:3-oxoacyl-ACP reductase FabG [Wenzhouxiangella marina]AKS43366.1 3-oxoacyl-[acyl-carrier protein] reductase [Wenzhouxiangella marina]MBB6088518.1 3-oxoacyl-[acyl-carrier protein] reductase [Wenzhouxiangella marina]